MELIDGKAVAAQIKQEIAAEVEQIVAAGGKRPHLAAILVGHDGVHPARAVGTAQGARWVRCGPVSKKGHPHHPLYLRRDEPLIPFDSIVNTTKASFATIQSLKERKWVDVD